MGGLVRRRIASEEEDEAVSDQQLGAAMRVVFRAFRQGGAPAPANLTRLPARPMAEAAKEPPPWVSIKDAAEMTGQSERTIRRALADGSLRREGVRGNRIRRFELDRWMVEVVAHQRPGHVDGDEDADVNEALDRILNDGK